MEQEKVNEANFESISMKFEILTEEGLKNSKGIRVNPFEGESCTKCNSTSLEGTLEERRCLSCGHWWKV